MKISFAICTHNEGDYIRQLLMTLISFILADKSGVEYEIIIIDDYSTDPETLKVFREVLLQPHFNDVSKISFHVKSHSLMGDYSAHKNFMNQQCSGDWIFNLDADELIPESLFVLLPLLIDNNPDVEAYWIPRINTVDGLTVDHVRKWGWVITKFNDFRKIKVIDSLSEEYRLLKEYQYIITDESGVVTYFEPVIMWPDPQMRFYKNDARLQWQNKVHERLTGFTQFSVLPPEPEYAIRHFKEITRQEQQNAFYETIK
jgi:glycosyltransferase involved in cell wall biosynthesis